LCLTVAVEMNGHGFPAFSQGASDAVARHVVDPRSDIGSGTNQPEMHAQIVAVARTQHDAMLANATGANSDIVL